MLRSLIKSVGCSAAVALMAVTSAAADGESWKSELPEWLKRTDIEFHKDSDSELRFSTETIQPLFQALDLSSTVFVQGRASYRDEDWTTNIGLGYRYLLPDASWLIGINGWWDRSHEYDHARWGIGGELMGSLVTGRVNYYDAYTDWRLVELTKTSIIEEKALDGFDLELELPAPYMPWMRLSGQYYRWIGEEKDDIVGFAGALKVDVTENTFLAGRFSTDNTETTFGLDVRLRLGAPQGVEYTAAGTGIASSAFTPRDLRKHVLDRVERHHDIVVERRTSLRTAPVGFIKVSRGT